eukprot:comp12558_c0_seq1/m.16561 comp12558_c0_seq1/g.16561  ORF comp12558_c0_seq1/g.16561 comp12558_c0_seq1/m.16561 type:complete len:228 (-) comp12558_c0_seq1:36-719(-)
MQGPRRRSSFALIYSVFIILFLTVACDANTPATQDQQDSGPRRYKLKGTVRGLVGEDGAANPLSRKERMGLRLALNGGMYVAYLRDDASFVFHDVPPGNYLLEVLSQKFHFPSLRVDITARNNAAKVRVTLGNDPHQVLPYPLVIAPIKPMQFFQVKEGFSGNFISQNWITLLMVGFMGMMMIFPKLLNIDPDQMKEIQEQMAKDQSQVLGGLFNQNKNSGHNSDDE